MLDDGEGGMCSRPIVQCPNVQIISPDRLIDCHGDQLILREAKGCYGCAILEAPQQTDAYGEISLGDLSLELHLCVGCLD